MLFASGPLGPGSPFIPSPPTSPSNGDLIIVLRRQLDTTEEVKPGAVKYGYTGIPFKLNTALKFGCD